MWSGVMGKKAIGTAGDQDLFRTIIAEFCRAPELASWLRILLQKWEYWEMTQASYLHQPTR